MLCYGVIQGFQDILCADVKTPLLWFPPFGNILCQFVATPIPFTYTKTVAFCLPSSHLPRPDGESPQGQSHVNVDLMQCSSLFQGLKSF